MKENFSEIRLFLFKELKRLATLPKDDDANLYHEMSDRIYAMEKIIDMLKITVNDIDEELKKIEAPNQQKNNDRTGERF